MLFAEFHILYNNLLFLHNEGSVSMKADNCPNERVYSLLLFCRIVIISHISISPFCGEMPDKVYACRDYKGSDE